MPTPLLIVLVLGGLLLLAGGLPRLASGLPRVRRDLAYVRITSDGARLTVYRGDPVRVVARENTDWTADERAAFDPNGVPVDSRRAADAIDGLLRRHTRRFPFRPLIVLHAFPAAAMGLSQQDRRELRRTALRLGGRTLVGDMPTTFPDAAFQELRDVGLGPWKQAD